MFSWVFRSAYYVFLVAIVSLVLLLLATLIPVKDWYQVKIVLSGSMEPAIAVGSIVVIKPEPVYVVGDIITFDSGNRNDIPVTHRIVDIEGDTFITKGDANEDLDPYAISRTAVIGKSVLVLPYIGYLLDFVKTPTGFWFFVIVPGVIIALEELVTICRELFGIRKRRQINVTR